MDLFNGLLKIIEEKKLRQKYGSGKENRMLAFWLNGWPAYKPALPNAPCFRDIKTGKYIFTATFGPKTLPGLMGRIVCYLDEIKKLGHVNFELHVSTSVEFWFPIPEGEDDLDKDGTAEELLAGLRILKQFIAELYGEEAKKVFLNVNGQDAEEEHKSLCKLLKSNL